MEEKELKIDESEFGQIPTKEDEDEVERKCEIEKAQRLKELSKHDWREWEREFLEYCRETGQIGQGIITEETIEKEIFQNPFSFVSDMKLKGLNPRDISKQQLDWNFFVDFF